MHNKFTSVVDVKEFLEEHTMLHKMWEKKNGNVSGDLNFRSETGFGGDFDDATKFSGGRNGR